MKKSFAALLALLICLACGSVQAQRRILPAVELVDVPAAIAATKSLSAPQIRGAIVAAALAAQWDVEPMPDGSLTLVLYKDMEYRITMRATYTDAAYTLRYVGSENLKMETGEQARASDFRSQSHADYAKEWRINRGSKQPEFKYAVDRADVWIHPTYELMVYELSAGVRRHLRLL